MRFKTGVRLRVVLECVLLLTHTVSHHLNLNWAFTTSEKKPDRPDDNSYPTM